MSLPWEANDALFVSELVAAKPWETVVAAALRVEGFDVVGPSPLEVRRSWADRTRFAGTPDLLVDGVPVEVKSRRLRFLSASDYPFDTAYVDVVRKTLPLNTFIVSRVTGAVLLIPQCTWPAWRQVSTVDQVRHLRDRWWEAPLSCLFPPADWRVLP